MKAIYQKELRIYFTSFVGPLFIGAVLFLAGIYFVVYDLLMGYPYIGYALSSVVFLFLIAIPVLTMGIFAEEKKQGTDQLLLTAPVSAAAVVTGKFSAAATVFAIPTGIISLYPLLLHVFGKVPAGETILALTGFFLYGLSCISIGIFVSQLTESQVIAAVISFGILFLGYVMPGISSGIAATGNWLTSALGVFDMVSRFEDMLNGSLQVESLVYYLSVIILFWAFTVFSIRKRRYETLICTRMPYLKNNLAVLFCIMGVILLNIAVSNLSVQYTVHDLTAERLYSLTDKTKEMLTGLEEEIHIYVLAKEEEADRTLALTLENYEAENSNIKITYVDPAVNPQFYKKYTENALTDNSVIVESGKRSRVVDYESMYQTQFDYVSYSTSITGYDGEGQLTGAIAYVTEDKMPEFYFLEGQGELVFDSAFQTDINKKNIACVTINLMDYESIPQDAACVVINAPARDLSWDDTQKVLSYLEQGGDMLLILACTQEKMTNLEKLLDFYGVRETEGIVMEQDKNRYYENPFFLLPSIQYDAITQEALSTGSYIFVPYAKGLTAEKRENVSVLSLLSSSEKSFSRVDFQEYEQDYKKQKQDIAGPFDLGLKCTRQVEKGESTAVIYSSESLFSRDADSIVSGTNRKLFSGTLDVLAEYSASLVIPVKNYNMEYLVIPQNILLLLAVLTAFVIPFGFWLTGFLIWFRRRKR